MKINVSFLAALLLVGTDLVARAAMQGVELALVLTAFEYWLFLGEALIPMGKNDFRR
jgi:hypothetical protein